MKKILFCTLPFLLAACAERVQQSTVPMDMQAVQDYRHKVATGKTVDPNAKPDDQALNQSDKRPKAYPAQVRTPVIYPSIGIGYGYHRHRHHW